MSESFEAIPFAIEEGRKILRNVQRVAKLFVAKSVFAAVLILTVGVGGGSYPFLPRQLSLAAAITVGIPAFLLALAPAAQAPPKAFMRDVAEFAIPAGIVLGVAVLLGHGLVHTSIGRSAAESQTTSTDDPRRSSASTSCSCSSRAACAARACAARSCRCSSGCSPSATS